MGYSLAKTGGGDDWDADLLLDREQPVERITKTAAKDRIQIFNVGACWQESGRGASYGVDGPPPSSPCKVS
ncbi:hypothetical protein Poly41_25220 [Novipirellula artificiosorum]|uniref:Uncharacterized protein n=1 Tax=Novipirellula artificiosorum TaxID=2528016 RepID=A0A5C6DXC0_9BACT|nr:hypothetical protein Poly41_25220 [Novipirellula artificiosorum]